MEQRILCLHILKERFHITNCGRCFIESGGYRLLKKYIKLADEEDSVHELIMIVGICKALPFDAEIIKDSEIGKVINKLLKFKYKHHSLHSSDGHNGNSSNSSQVEDLMLLQKEVKALKELWKNSVTLELAKSSSVTNTESSVGGNTNTNTNTADTVPDDNTASSPRGNSSPRLGHMSTTAVSSKRVELSPECMDLLEAVNERLYTEKIKTHQLSRQSSTTGTGVGLEKEASTAMVTEDSATDHSMVETKLQQSPSTLSSTDVTTTAAAAKSGTSLLQILTKQQQMNNKSTPSTTTNNINTTSNDITSFNQQPPSLLNNLRTDRQKGIEMMADKAKKMLAAKELAEKMRNNVNIMDLESSSSLSISSESGSATWTGGVGAETESSHAASSGAGIYLEVNPNDPEAYANNVYTPDGQVVRLLSLREINKPVTQYKGIKSCLKKSTPEPNSGDQTEAMNIGKILLFLLLYYILLLIFILLV